MFCWGGFFAAMFSKHHKLGVVEALQVSIVFSNESCACPSNQHLICTMVLLLHRHLPPLTKFPRKVWSVMGQASDRLRASGWGGFEWRLRWGDFERRKWSYWTISLSTKKLGKYGNMNLDNVLICPDDGKMNTERWISHAVIVYIFSTSIIYISYVWCMYMYYLF